MPNCNHYSLCNSVQIRRATFYLLVATCLRYRNTECFTSLQCYYLHYRSSLTGHLDSHRCLYPCLQLVVVYTVSVCCQKDIFVSIRNISTLLQFHNLRLPLNVMQYFEQLLNVGSRFITLYQSTFSIKLCVNAFL